MKTQHIKSIFVILIILSVAISVNGQPLPTQHGGGGGTWVGDSAPLDASPAILIFLGSLYAIVKKYISARKLNKEDYKQIVR